MVSQRILGLGVIAAIIISIFSTIYTAMLLNEARENINRINSNINNLSENISRISALASGAISSIENLNSSIRSIERGITNINNTVSSLGELVRASIEPRVSVKYAKLFQISYDGPAKIVRDAEGQKILLIPRTLSTQRDIVNLYISRYTPDYVIYTPVERVILMSATQVSMILRLEDECRVSIINTSIMGIMWGKQYTWYVPKISDMLSKGALRDYGPADNPNVEMIIASKPDLVVIYTYAGSPVFRTLKSSGLPVVVDNEYLENKLLGRFEWIKFLAVFFNLDGCAESLFNRVENTIDILRQAISNRAPVESLRPVVAWFSVFGGRIYASPPASYVVDAITIAGGRYAFIDIPYGSVSQELVVSRSQYIDVMIYSSSKDYGPKSIEELVKAVPFVKDIKAVREGRVYVFAPTYWQLGTTYPEDIIRDLAKIFYPDIQDLAGWNLTFFEKLT